MNWAERDHAAIWHPFTQHHHRAAPFVIQRGEGAYLIDEHNRYYLDLISSWWVNIHGHSHPDIANAIAKQAQTLEQVIFSDMTHEPAILVAEKLLALLPTGFSKIFYSDNGSTAVEVALKMAYQYWRNQGVSERKRFIAFNHAYHGDTFGAMSVGKASGFFPHFEDLFFDVKLFSLPITWLDDENVEEKEQQVLTEIGDYLAEHGREVAGLILEPLVQGAGGMQMYRPSFLSALEKLVRSYQGLIIYDEVMTGFGRTGKIFACEKAQTSPDIICLAKGLTGGFLPLAVTACHEKIYQAFLGETFATALAHGHSFTANPLGCAAALASLALLTEPKTLAQIRMIEAVHQDQLASLATFSTLEKRRYCGTIAAFDFKMPGGYGSTHSLQLREICLKKGLLVRPLGNVIYLLPPYCITENELRAAYTTLIEVIEGVSA